jgi:hypothetical protein
MMIGVKLSSRIRIGSSQETDLEKVIGRHIEPLNANMGQWRLQPATVSISINDQQGTTAGRKRIALGKHVLGDKAAVHICFKVSRCRRKRAGWPCRRFRHSCNCEADGKVYTLMIRDDIYIHWHVRRRGWWLRCRAVELENRECDRGRLTCGHATCHILVDRA